MKRFQSLLFILVFSLLLSTSFADDYSVNVLARQISNIQGVVEVDISELMPGEKLEVGTSGGPIWVYRRTQEQLDFIAKNYTGSSEENLEAIVSRIKRKATSTSGYLHARLQLVDQPALEKSPYRSKKHEYFVFSPLGRLGCRLTMQLPPDMDSTTGAWLVDPCFNQIYDFTGQFLSQSGAIFWMNTGEPVVSDRETFPRTEIPPHRYRKDGTLVIGVADITATPEISLCEVELYSGLSPTEVLYQATAFNDIERARSAIKQGADATSNAGFIPDPKVSLALRRAVYYSSVEMVELLLSHGAVPTEIEMDGAKIYGREDISKLLDAASN